jgi:hypothetical protein
MDGDRAVQFDPVAGRLARVVADPPGDRRHRVVLENRDVPVEIAVVFDVIQVLLDLLAGRAGVVAGRRLVAVDRPVEPETRPTSGPGSI